MVVRLAHVCIETDDFGPTEEFYSYLGINRQFEFRNKQNELVGVYLNPGTLNVQRCRSDRKGIGYRPYLDGDQS